MIAGRPLMPFDAIRVIRAGTQCTVMHLFQASEAPHTHTHTQKHTHTHPRTHRTGPDQNRLETTYQAKIANIKPTPLNPPINQTTLKG